MAMTLRLSDEDDAELQRLADRLGQSKQQVVVAAVRRLVAEHDRSRRIDEILDQEIPRWRNVLDRLAE